jgi:uncharacterized Zn finger protein (UPF0148 family)
MAFKTKTKTRLLIDDRQTLDAKHNNILKSFTDNKDTLTHLYNELNVITIKLNDLIIQNAKFPIFNFDIQKLIWFYDDKKKEIEIEINRIENNIDETDYMLKTGKLISNYYKIINEETKITYNDDKNHNDDTNNDNDVDNDVDNNNDNNNNDDNNDAVCSDAAGSSAAGSDFSINNNNNNENGKENENDNIFSDNDNNKFNYNFKNNINKYKNQKTQLFTHQSKDIIYNKYMKLIDKNYISTTNNNKDDVFDTCDKCSIEMLLNNNTGQLTCPNCGFIENIIVDSDKPSFKEPPKEMTSFCYKRINHLNEFLAQFQAKETTDIPESVYNDIIMEIKKERIKNMAVITPDKMRIILKKIKKNDYYEHIPYIINQLNGLPAPVISPEIEEIIRGMFKAIQIPFEKYCPFKRKNFLSYNYVMYKFFELLELDEYLTCFQLLKSRTKLHQQDQIWKNICKDLNWQYINSL